MKNQLLNCPLCEGEAKVTHIHEDNGMPEVYYREMDCYIVQCKKCNASSTGVTEQMAIDRWNRRKDGDINRLPYDILSLIPVYEDTEEEREDDTENHEER